MHDTISGLALALTQILSAHKVYLEPKKGGYFNPLVEQLNNVVPANQVESLEQYCSLTNQIYAESRPNIFSVGNEDLGLDTGLDEDGLPTGNIYDIISEQASADIKEVVEKIFYSARNLALPAISSIMEKVNERMQEVIDSGKLAISVKTDHSELALWANPTLLGLLNAGNNSDSMDQKVPVDVEFPDLPTEELMNRLSTGNDLLDAEINEFLTQFDKGSLVEHSFHECFARSEAGVYAAQGELPEAVVSFLLACSFRNDIPEGVVGVEIDLYNVALSRVINYHASIIKRCIDRFNYSTESGRIVMSYPKQGAEFTEGTVIVVNGRIYNTFLENGGSVDLLFGAYIDGSEVSRETPLLEQASRFENAWNRHIDFARARQADQFQSLFAMAIRNEINKYSVESGFPIKDAGFEKLYSGYIITKDNAYNVGTEVILAVMFPNKEYTELVRNLNNVCLAFPDMGMEAAMELALIDWLVDWALGHVNVVVG